MIVQRYPRRPRLSNSTIEYMLDYIKYIILHNESRVVFGEQKYICERSSHTIPLFLWKMALEELGFNAYWVGLYVHGYEHLGILKYRYGLVVDFPENYKN